MPGGHPPGTSRVVFDTNPFLLLVTYRYFESENATAQDRMRALSDVRRRDDNLTLESFKDLWYIFEHAKRRIVTQHVVAEALKFDRAEWLKNHKDGVWKAAISLLKEIEELPCPICDLLANAGYGPVLIALGSTDAGLLHTAEQHKATLITEDELLLGFANHRSVPAYPLNQLSTLIAQSR